MEWVIGQSPNFKTRYYNSELGPSSSNFGQGYYDWRTDSSSLYMHCHGHGHGEDNEYLNYEAPVALLEQPDEQQRVQSRRWQLTWYCRRPDCETH